MNNITTYIFCHNQNFIIESVKTQRYAAVGNHFYVFMGLGDVSKLDFDNVIICRNLPLNIEKEKNCLQYCGWRAIYLNDIVKSDIIRLLDYDVDIIEINNDLPKNLKSYMGFDFDFYFKDGFGGCNEFNKNVQTMFKLTLSELINNYVSKYEQTKWTSVGGLMLTSDLFLKFMKWFDPIYESNKHLHHFSHHFERYLSVFLLSNDIEYDVVENEAIHRQLKSHSYY